MAFADIKPEIPRTFFHVLGGVFLVGVAHLAPAAPRLWFLGSIFAIALVVDLLRLRHAAISNACKALLGSYMRPSEARRLTGAPAFTLGIFLAYLFFPPVIALAAVTPLIIGDRAGLLVGKGFGRIRFWGKTVEGSMACFVASLLALAAMALAVPHLMPFGWAALTGVAAVGTAAEALPRPVDDNLAIPLACGLFLRLVT